MESIKFYYYENYLQDSSKSKYTIAECTANLIRVNKN